MGQSLVSLLATIEMLTKGVDAVEICAINK